MKFLLVKITESFVGDNYSKAITEKYYIPLLFSTTLYIEPRSEDGTDWKFFVTIKLFGIKVLQWHYRDEYIRERYIKDLNV